MTSFNDLGHSVEKSCPSATSQKRKWSLALAPNPMTYALRLLPPGSQARTRTLSSLVGRQHPRWLRRRWFFRRPALPAARGAPTGLPARWNGLATYLRARPVST